MIITENIQNFFDSITSHIFYRCCLRPNTQLDITSFSTRIFMYLEKITQFKSQKVFKKQHFVSLNEFI